jgi:hypothetical protein
MPQLSQLEEENMIPNCRFVLNEEGRVVDTLNPVHSVQHYWFGEDPEDAKDDLRACVVWARLPDIVEKLIINPRPTQNEDRYAIASLVFAAIKASHLNSFDPTISVERKFGGTLKRQKQRTQDIVSLSLFRDDIERLLRDLYGDIESEAMDSVLSAVFRIVKAFTKYTCPDLWKEHHDAGSFDYIVGTGISHDDWRRGMVAKCDLILRVKEVRAKSSAFSDYTVEFADRFCQHWVCSLETAARAPNGLDDLHF